MLDFGIAIERGSAHGVAGTVEYMAPELFLGRPPSVASDLYAVGVLLCLLTTGSLPIERSSKTGLLEELFGAGVDLTLPEDAAALLASFRPVPRSRPPDGDVGRAVTLAAPSRSDDASAGAGAVSRVLATRGDTGEGRGPDLDAFATVTLPEGERLPVPHEPSGPVLPAGTQLSGPLADIALRLLSRRPEDRFHDAAEVLAALAQATGVPLPLDTQATRESFLQASELVGREVELGELLTGLERLDDGRGAAFLLGGESGVGKTRLLAELRTLALVSGAAVAAGQAVAESGSAYLLLRPVVRALALRGTPPPAQLSVLCELIADLGPLLGVRPEPPPRLSFEEAQERLFTAVEALLRAQPQPTVVLLEDLHWADECSLLLCERLGALCERLPILLVATFRDDEAPLLPARLGDYRLLRLGRLERAGVAALCRSMLGADAAARPELIEYLCRETEGNLSSSHWRAVGGGVVFGGLGGWVRCGCA